MDTVWLDCVDQRFVFCCGTVTEVCDRIVDTAVGEWIEEIDDLGV